MEPVEHAEGMGAIIPIQDQVSAEKNGLNLVQLWAADGSHDLYVSADKADLMQRAYGFRRTRLDLDATLADAKALFAPTEAALDAYIADVKASGFVNTHHEASRATLLAAWELLNQTLARLVRDSVTLYEEREAAS